MFYSSWHRSVPSSNRSVPWSSKINLMSIWSKKLSLEIKITTHYFELCLLLIKSNNLYLVSPRMNQTLYFISLGLIWWWTYLSFKLLSFFLSHKTKKYKIYSSSLFPFIISVKFGLSITNSVSDSLHESKVTEVIVSSA